MELMQKKQSQQQSGGVLILMALCCLLLLGILAYAVDLPRGQIEVTELQNALDAAALAGARQLDGTGSGINRAQDAILTVLANNNVGGDPLNADDVEIEFGFYAASDNANYSFEGMALEGVYGGIPVESLINAVRVQGTNQTPTVFGRVWGFTELGRSDRQAVAVANRELEQCVLPFAVPACQLLLNQDPNDDGYYTDKVDYEKQCARELIITEASFWEPLPYAQRGLGFMRYQWLTRLPSVQFDGPNKECGVASGGLHPNCRAEVIQGTMAVPPNLLKEFSSGGHENQQSVAVPPDIFLKIMEDLLDKKNCPSGENCLKCSPVKLGTFLHPLENAVDTGDGLLLAQEKSQKLQSLLYDFIQKDVDNPTFTAAFGDARSSTAEYNYPFLRSKPEDRVIMWPNYQEDHQILMDDMGPWQYTNPMCHYRGTDADGNQQETPVDSPDEGRVREVVIMLVAPGVEEADYCDFNFQYNKADAVSAVPPSEYYKPRVVGFASAYLFDFNFSNLSEEFTDEAPKYIRKGQDNTTELLIDKNPLAIIAVDRN